MSEQSKIKYLKWMQRNEPYIFAVGMRRLEMQGDGSMGAINWGSIGSNIGKAFSTVANTASNLAPQYLQYKQQKKVMDMQMKRAEQGLPPANVEDYTPAVKLRVDASPETQAAITRTAVTVSERATSKLMPVFLIGGLGIAAAIFLRKKRR